MLPKLKRADSTSGSGRKKRSLRRTRGLALGLFGPSDGFTPNEYEDSKSAERKRAQWLQRQRPPHW